MQIILRLNCLKGMRPVYEQKLLNLSHMFEIGGLKINKRKTIKSKKVYEEVET